MSELGSLGFRQQRGNYVSDLIFSLIGKSLCWETEQPGQADTQFLTLDKAEPTLLTNDTGTCV